MQKSIAHFVFGKVSCKPSHEPEALVLLPGSPVGGGQAGPGARHRPSLTGAGARAGAAVGPAPVVPWSQVAGDTICLIRGLWD